MMAQKTVLSDECRALLEEIFAFFSNREEAQKNPEVCLEAVLGSIVDELTRERLFPPTLLGTLHFVPDPGAAEIIVENRREKQRKQQEHRQKLQERQERK